MEEDDILYQSIIADPEQVSPDVDVSGLRTQTETSPQLLAAVSEYPGLQFDPTQYSAYSDLMDLYSTGLPMIETSTVETPAITTPVVETEGGGGGSQGTGDLVTSTTTPVIETDTSMIGGDLDQGGLGDGITNYEYTPEETLEQQQAINQAITDLGGLYNPTTEVSTNLAPDAVTEINQITKEPSLLDTAISGVSTAAKNAFENVKSGASTAAQFIADYGYPAYQALQGNLLAAGTALVNPISLGIGFAGKIFEGMGDTKSKQEYDSYNEEQQSEIDKAYGPGGVMEGYNPISGFGQGVQATVQSRLNQRRASGIPDTSSTSQQLMGLQDILGITDFTQLTQEDIFNMDDVDPVDEGREIDFQTGEITGSPTGDVNIFDEVTLTGQTPADQIYNEGDVEIDLAPTPAYDFDDSEPSPTPSPAPEPDYSGYDSGGYDPAPAPVNDPTDRGGNGSGSSGGGGCVIATHAVDSGAFTSETKREAVRWCIKNLHRTWWGEAVRRGYRYYGQKAIEEGKAKNHYQEFKDYVAFGTGRKRTLKTAWTFVYRTIQFFIKGITIKDAKR